MDVGRFVGWLLLNIGVPILAPIALLLLLGLTKKYRYRVRELVGRSIGEGQLFWTIIAMCAAATYEAAVHIGEIRASSESGGDTTVSWFALGWHVLFIIISVILLSLHTMEAEDEGRADSQHSASEQVGSKEAIHEGSRIVQFSIGMAVVTAVSFTGTHLWVT